MDELPEDDAAAANTFTLPQARRREMDAIPNLQTAFQNGDITKDELNSYLFDDSEEETDDHESTAAPLPVIHLVPTGEKAVIIGNHDTLPVQSADVKPLASDAKPPTSDAKPLVSDVREVTLAQSKQAIPPSLADESIAGESDTSYLYPEVGVEGFGMKLARRREFYDTRYTKPVGDVEEIGTRLCNAEFELAPHQMFVRNFLSLQTPYNGALLYHGLGSGKTCSAIGVAEEMRDYMTQMGMSQRIIIVASPNVQENFRLQLFDERKLRNVDGLWDLQSCTGNRFLREINPTGIKDIPKSRVVSQINRIISGAYLFLGYIEFANYIAKQASPPDDLAQEKQLSYSRDRLRRTFGGRLIIVDEIHNIRMTNENRDKRLAAEMDRLVDNVPDMRLLFLSATPMYNSHREIVWLLNLLRRNDRREPIAMKNVFSADGSFVIDEMGKDVGRRELVEKATGYVSFVRGDNPYTFPYRVWPSSYSPEHTFSKQPRPIVQLNGQMITRPIEHVDVYLTTLGTHQARAYGEIISRLESGEFGQPETIASGFSEMESFGYTLLQRPLEALNIAYPYIPGENSVKDFVGKGGLDSVMTFTETVVPPQKYDFRYKQNVPRVFAQSVLPEYSGKIASITDSILEAKGIVLVYSQYIDGGLVPMALALEELGFVRRGSGRNLFAKGEVTNARNAGYVMITGDRAITPDPVKDLKACTDPENADGSRVQVVLISQAGSEGLDFRNIRQVHVLEPWYNMNRIEQIIGRGVRTCSHKDLPFSQRNVQIFLHATVLNDRDSEAADVYVYRLAESKALQIGEVSRALKRGAVDCLLNLEQMGFSAAQLNTTVQQTLANGDVIQHRVGDKPFTAACDYLSTCEYSCVDGEEINPADVVDDTYSVAYVNMNVDRIVQRIRALMKEEYVYSRDTLISMLHAERGWPIIQMDAALSKLVDDNGEHITDRYGRLGRLVNIGRFYLFQPIEITDRRIPIEERSAPVEVKRTAISFGTPDMPIDTTVAVESSVPLQILIDRSLMYLKGETAEAIDEWTENLPRATEFLRTLLSVSDDALKWSVVGHYCDFMSMPTMIETLNDPSALDSTITDYINYLTFTAETEYGPIYGIPILDSDGTRRVVVKRADDPWQLASPEDMYELEPSFTRYANAHLTPTENGYEMEFSSYVGYIGIFTKTKELVFRTKKMTAKGNTGARCDQAKRTETSYKILASAFPDRTFTTKNTDLPQAVLCVAIEILLRIFQKDGRDSKTWFLAPGLASTLDIRQITSKQ